MTIFTTVSVPPGVHHKTVWFPFVGGLKLMGSEPSCGQASI